MRTLHLLSPGHSALLTLAITLLLGSTMATAGDKAAAHSALAHGQQHGLRLTRHGPVLTGGAIHISAPQAKSRLSAAARVAARRTIAIHNSSGQAIRLRVTTTSQHPFIGLAITTTTAHQAGAIRPAKVARYTLPAGAKATLNIILTGNYKAARPGVFNDQITFTTTPAEAATTAKNKHGHAVKHKSSASIGGEAHVALTAYIFKLSARSTGTAAPLQATVLHQHGGPVRAGGGHAGGGRQTARSSRSGGRRGSRAATRPRTGRPSHGSTRSTRSGPVRAGPVRAGRPTPARRSGSTATLSPYRASAAVAPMPTPAASNPTVRRFQRPAGYTVSGEKKYGVLRRLRWADLPFRIYSNHRNFGPGVGFDVVLDRTLQTWNALAWSIGVNKNFFVATAQLNQADIVVDWSGKGLPARALGGAKMLTNKNLAIANGIVMRRPKANEDPGRAVESLLQELGHMLGLGHSNNRSDIMTPVSHGHTHPKLNYIQLTNRDREMVGWLYQQPNFVVIRSPKRSY